MSDTEANRQVVSDSIDVIWRQGALDRLGEFWTEDCINHAAAHGGQGGLDAVRAYHEQFGEALAAFADIHIELQQQIAEADRVVTQILTTLRHTGLFMGIPATGRTVTLATIRIDRLRDGRIAEHWSVADMAGLLAQMRG